MKIYGRKCNYEKKEIKNKIDKLQKELDTLQEELNSFIKIESIIILDPKTTLEDYDYIYKKINEILEESIYKTEMIGIKKLAYEVKKCNTGYYLIFDWEGNSDKLNELERFFRIEDNIIKYLNVKLERDEE